MDTHPGCAAELVVKGHLWLRLLFCEMMGFLMIADRLDLLKTPVLGFEGLVNEDLIAI